MCRRMAGGEGSDSFAAGDAVSNACSVDKERHKCFYINENYSAEGQMESSAQTCELVQFDEQEEEKQRALVQLVIGKCEFCAKRRLSRANSAQIGQIVLDNHSQNSEPRDNELVVRVPSTSDPSNWTFGPPPSSSRSGSLKSDLSDVMSSNSRGSNSSAFSFGSSDSYELLASSSSTDSASTQSTRTVASQTNSTQTGPKPIIPLYIQDLLVHHSHSARCPVEERKLAKAMSKQILLPPDPKHPTAFTTNPGLPRGHKLPWCSSKPVLKIVGTTTVLMTIAIVAIIVYLHCYTNVSRPMMM